MTQTTIEQPFTHAPAARTGQRARLDARRYTSREQHQQEWDSVWTRSWLFAGLLSDVRECDLSVLARAVVSVEPVVLS